MAVRGSGELKVEFYSHLNEIKDLYFNQGFVVFKILHQELIKRYNLSLSYQAFCYYARKELKKSSLSSSNSSKEQSRKNSEGDVKGGSSKKKAHEPIIATFSMSDIKPYNPHTSPIDESRILR